MSAAGEIYKAAGWWNEHFGRVKTLAFALFGVAGLLLIGGGYLVSRFGAIGATAMVVGLLVLITAAIAFIVDRRMTSQVAVPSPSGAAPIKLTPELKARLDRLKVDRTVGQRERDREVGELLRRFYKVKNRMENVLPSGGIKANLLFENEVIALLNDARGFVWQHARMYASGLPQEPEESRLLKGSKEERLDLVKCYIALLERIALYVPPESRQAEAGEAAELIKLGVLPLATELRDIRRKIEKLKSMAVPLYWDDFQLPAARWDEYHKVLAARPELYEPVERAYVAANDVNEAVRWRRTTATTPNIGVAPSDPLDEAYRVAGEALDALGQPRGDRWESEAQKAAGQIIKDKRNDGLERQDSDE